MTKLTPITIDKYGITYEAMDQRVAQGMTWYGFPIAELALKTDSFIGGERMRQRREESRKMPTLASLLGNLLTF